jgi:hypothetical protein
MPTPFRLPALLAGCLLVASCQPLPTADSAGGLSAARGSAGVKSVTVSPSSATIQLGGTVQLTATTKPASSASFVWSSSNSSVAAVSQTGWVTGVAAGSAEIRATTGGKTGRSQITVTALPPPPPTGVTLVGAGDIADCNVSEDEATAQLLDGIEGTVFLLGDNAYENGSTADYTNCFEPTWGRHKSRTRPVPGNHEYQTSGASGYFGYFGTAAAGPDGYYSYDLGEWHIVVLNSNIARDAASPQIAWLRQDLAASTRTCTLAYWHHPRFSSGYHGNNTSVQPFWEELYAAGAELVLVGHDHNYERFAPQTPSGVADPVNGIRQFVVGTGGRALRGLGSTKANSELFRSDTHGVLKLTLGSGSYAWTFVPIAGQTFTDSGTGSCH